MSTSEERQQRRLSHRRQRGWRAVKAPAIAAGAIAIVASAVVDLVVTLLARRARPGPPK